jgi:hypothetical protein
MKTRGSLCSRERVRLFYIAEQAVINDITYI